MNAVKKPEEAAATTIAEYSPTAVALADLRTRYEGVVFDVASGKGMDQAKKARAELREHRVSLERERVRIKAPALERCRQIDSEAKRITAELESLELPIDDQIKSEEHRKEREKQAREEAERERIAAINARFDAIRALPQRAHDATLAQIDEVLAEARAIDPASFPDDLQDSAKYERQAAINALLAARDRREVADQERAELERLRAASAAVEAERERLAQLERDRIAAEERAAREREEAARIEQARQDAAREAEERREREAAEAERRLQEQREEAARAQAAAVQAERERAERELAQREQAARDEAARIEREREKREANRRHVAGIHRAALAALVEHNVDEAEGKRIIELIATGKVPAVSIAY